MPYLAINEIEEIGVTYLAQNMNFLPKLLAINLCKI